MRNYTLWMADDGTEFGTEFGDLECDDWAAVCATLAGSDIHTRRQSLMSDFLDTAAGSGQGG